VRLNAHLFFASREYGAGQNSVFRTCVNLVLAELGDKRILPSLPVFGVNDYPAATLTLVQHFTEDVRARLPLLYPSYLVARKSLTQALKNVYFSTVTQLVGSLLLKLLLHQFGFLLQRFALTIKLGFLLKQSVVPILFQGSSLVS